MYFVISHFPFIPISRKLLNREPPKDSTCETSGLTDEETCWKRWTDDEISDKNKPLNLGQGGAWGPMLHLRDLIPEILYMNEGGDEELAKRERKQELKTEKLETGLRGIGIYIDREDELNEATKRLPSFRFVKN